MTEFELIAHYFNQQLTQQRHAQADGNWVIEKGLGDDAAVVSFATAQQWVTCVDTLVQGRHFSEDWQQVSELAFAIGYKAVAVNVSDIAAMGATPHSILLALALPQRLANESWLSEFSKGLFHACAEFSVQLIGGDTTRNDKLVVSITANGVMPTNKTPIYRSGAQVGDKVYVSGTVGDACYALYYPHTKIGQQLAHRLHKPTPRIALGQMLASQGLATAMIDVSDGLAQDLGHICQQSGVAMRLDLEKLPCSEPLKHVEVSQRLSCQLTGGDDYELAFTLPASVSMTEALMTSIDTQVTCIGEIVSVDNQDHNEQKLDGSCHEVIELSFNGNRVSPQDPYPFKKFPNLSGYQHFSNSST